MLVYTVPEVAKLLKISRKGVYNLINRGTLKAVKIGGVLRIRKEEIDRLLDENVRIANA